MKTLHTIKVLLLACVATLGFTACDNDDYSTNQYKGGVSLNAFGPSPVIRGGELRFYGSNLNQVTEVEIPGVAPIIDITVVQSGVPSEIRVTVPVDGPEVGLVTLRTANGTEITTLTELTYEEPIVIEGFSPAEAMPGDVITITGDYLNLMHEVIFAEEVVVPEEEFLEVSDPRRMIQVRVPEAAQTGQLILSDGAEEIPNWIYTEEELTIGSPTVQPLATETEFKAGETATLTGEYLNMVAYIRFNATAEEPYDLPAADLAEEDEASFTVNDEGTQISFELPAEAGSGAVELVLRSGLTVSVMDNFEVVVPTEMAIAAEAVKNGDVLTVTGQDMDLVVSVTFPGMTESVAVTEATATQITVTVPDMAQSGDLSLNMASGQSVTVPFVTVKPAITAFNPTALTAGEVVTITGTDLDLVASVVFGDAEDALSVDIASETTTGEEEGVYVDENTLRVTVPLTAITCVPKLVMKNGEEVETDVTLNITPATNPVITAIEPGSVKAGEEITITGLNINTVENFFFGDVKVTEYGTRTATEVTLTVPAEVTPDTYYLRMVNYAGDEIISSVPVIIEAPEVEIWSGEWECTGWAGNQDLAWGGHDWSTFEVGQTIIFVVGFTDPTATWAAISPRVGDGWANLSVSQIDLVPSAEDQRVEYTPTAQDISDLQNKGGLVVTGDGFIMKQVLIR